MPTRTPTAQPPPALLWQTQRLVCPRLPVDESCHTCGWVMSHIWMSHVTRVDESCHTCGWVMSHVGIRHINESRPYLWQVSCLTHVGGMSLIYMRMHDMTYSYVCHDSFICVPWLIHMCDMTHSYVWHESDLYVDTHMQLHVSLQLPVHASCAWVMAHVWMSHGTRMNESWHTYEWVMAHVWMSHGTRMNQRCRMCAAWVWCTRMTRRCSAAWVFKLLCTGHMTRINESNHTHEWVHFAHVNEACHAYEWVMSHM